MVIWVISKVPLRHLLKSNMAHWLLHYTAGDTYDSSRSFGYLDDTVRCCLGHTGSNCHKNVQVWFKAAFILVC